MRRRLREQRRVREALLLDLGALVFELHRHGRREPELLQAKASELSRVDAEVRGLSEALEAELGVVELVSAGIAGSCETCDALLSTDTRFCPVCGAATKPGLEARRGESPPPVPVERQVEAHTEEHERWEDAEDEGFDEEAEQFDEEPEPAEEEPGPEEEPEPEVAPWLADPEPEPEPDPEPEPEPDPEPEPEPEHEPDPTPEPVRVKRPMGRLERTLRGRRKEGS